MKDDHLVSFSLDGNGPQFRQVPTINDPDERFVAARHVELVGTVDDREVIGGRADRNASDIARGQIHRRELVLAITADEKGLTVFGDVQPVQKATNLE